MRSLVRWAIDNSPAMNMLMIGVLLTGTLSFCFMRREIFPEFDLEIVLINVPYPGASPEEVEEGICQKIEEAVRSIDGIKKMTSVAKEGSGSVVLELRADVDDVDKVVTEVRSEVDRIPSFPELAEDPEVQQITMRYPVIKVGVLAPQGREAFDELELRAVTERIREDLLHLKTVTQVNVQGSRDYQIDIEMDENTLRKYGLTLQEVAQIVRRENLELPGGTLRARGEEILLRGKNKQLTGPEIAQLPLVTDPGGVVLTIGDLGTVRDEFIDTTAVCEIDNRPGLVLSVDRTTSEDILAMTAEVRRYVDGAKLPGGYSLVTWGDRSVDVKDRLDMLIQNGIMGLFLVFLVLAVFLELRLAFWVALGIPVAMLGAGVALFATGQTLNMLSMFALIMALGIIVDDAIVVGEDALAHYQAGEPPLEAAEGGARRMLAPVIASSLTTIAAFLPLMLVGGVIGNVLFDIPLIVVCVIAASLVESFLVLPGHLRQAFEHIHGRPVSALRQRIDARFEQFREGRFRTVVGYSVDNPWTTLSIAVALLLLSVGLFAGGRLAFHFLPSPDGKLIYARTSFVAGTPPARTEAFLAHVKRALRETEAALGGNLVEVATTHRGIVGGADDMPGQVGDQFGTTVVELVEPDSRDVRNTQFMREWRDRVRLPAGIESFSIVERRPGPPGRDIDIRLTDPGNDVAKLKAAALDLASTLGTISGVSGIDDDTPFGQEQLIYRLSAEGRALGLTVEDVGRQLRAAYDGRVAQIFQDGDDEVEVRVVLPDSERHNLASLGDLDLNIVTPSGGSVPLFTVLDVTTRRGFDILRHTDRKLSVRVSAAVDPVVNNINDVIADLEAGPLQMLKTRYGIEYAYEGRRSDQTETLGDMARGGLLALAMIYLVLAWVFASYGWPLVVMSVIPFGIIGALLGHWLMGLDLTILSLFGLFGLSGIVVNDSIILVMFYKQQKERGVAWRQAIVEATCQRLRAVLLTSLTTIAGLTPLMFETSRQAQFLIPMAVTISFGLAVATLLVLLVVPSLLCLHESFALRAERPAQPDTAGIGA